MRDINGNIIEVGDMVTSSQFTGEAEILRCLDEDGKYGALLRVRTADRTSQITAESTSGKVFDLRVKLAQVELVAVPEVPRYGV